MPNPLERRLKAMIRLSGPISLADYMALALGDPEHGYYMAREPFGAKGDFVTAPEVSQMFGELIAAWAIHVHERMGSPAPLQLVELGPGRGTLMRDLLRAARVRPGFLEAARLSLVETSPRLRAVQAETLADGPLAPTFADRFEDVPEGPLLVVANEFFDALPIRQWVRADGAFRERVIGLDAADRLVFGLGPARLDETGLPPSVRAAPNGAVLETAAAAAAVMTAIARRLAAHGGAALAVDYGYAETALGDTLQAIRRHDHADPLADPGEQDLTAHVNFEALARAARAAGAAVHGPMGQGEFLLALGLLERAGRLGTGKDAATQERLRGEVERLAGPDEMGTLFKVLAVSGRLSGALFPFGG